MAEIKNRLQILIERQRLPHAMAFAGGSAEMRRELASWLAKTLDCHVNRGSLLQVEPDGVQIKLEQAKSILDFLSLSRLAPSRLIVIDEAQQLNPQAANALLKIVEEPPENSYILMLTPSFSLLMPTLRSRTQVFRLAFAESEMEYDPKLVGVVEQALNGLVKQDRASWSQLVDHVKDRETAMQVAQLCQRMLRERALETPNHPQLLKWWRSVFQLEQDIVANLDRTLLFENFYYQAHR